jgi:predicted peroxiredoxin
MMKRFGWTIVLSLAVLASIVLTQLAPSSTFVQAQNISPTQVAENGLKIVHLKHGVDDLRATYMALDVANDLQDRGSNVALLLTMDGTQIADTQRSLNLQWKDKPQTLATLYDSFVAKGGQVKVCPDCAEAGNSTNLRQGAQFTSEDSDISSLLMASSNVIEF